MLQFMLDVSTREHLPDLEAVAAKKMKRMDESGARTREGGIAVINITGPIFRYADYFTEISGGATIESLSRDFNAVLNDPGIKSIVLNIDSPGGEVAGTHEFAEMIFAARGQKPIVAYVDHLAASAAYWIASAADEIVTDATGLLGSIGVVITLPNPGARSSREIRIISSQSPRKQADPTTESGREEWQTLADNLAEVFVSTVARNRGVSAETVQNEFGRGGIIVGEKAVAAGLADSIGSFESLIADLQAGMTPKKRRKMAAHAAEQEEIDMSKFETLKGRLMAILASENDAELAKASTEPEDPDTEEAETEEPAEEGDEKEAARASGAIESENRKLREDLAIARAQQTRKDIESFLDASLGAGKILPAESASLRDLMLQAAQDDLISPMATGTRLDQMKSAISARQAHGLFEEKIVDGRHKVLKADENNQTELSDERKRELLQATPAGRAAISLVK
jgi:ClpP class serine protease